MGEAKRRGTLEERTRLAKLRVVPKSTFKAAKKCVTNRWLAGGMTIAMAAGVVAYDKQLHAPETAYRQITQVMQIIAKDGSSTGFSGIWPESQRLGFYGQA